MKKVFIFFCLTFTFFSVSADLNTDKTMAMIKHDTNTYISAESRANTIDDAYNNAQQELKVKISEFLKESGDLKSNLNLIDSLSSSIHFECLKSNNAENRYRVMLYAKKSDLITVRMNEKDTILTTTHSESSLIPDKRFPLDEKDKDYKITEDVLINPSLSQILNHRNASELIESLKSLRSRNKISGAAAYPLSSVNNFYIAIIDNENVIAIVHFKNGRYIDASSGEVLNIDKFTNYIGYWFTLP